eukprot:scaffold41248_cov45-Cyclotella_meneghiniana.AAC.1
MEVVVGTIIPFKCLHSKYICHPVLAALPWPFAYLIYFFIEAGKAFVKRLANHQFICLVHWSFRLFIAQGKAFIQRLANHQFSLPCPLVISSLHRTRQGIHPETG